MLNEIMVLLNTYNKANKIVDDKFYVVLFNILKRNKKISKYVNELIIINKNNFNDPKYSKYTDGG